MNRSGASARCVKTRRPRPRTQPIRKEVSQMSIASDTRTSVDAAIEVAVEQGKRALEAAQVSLGKLQHNVNSARSLDSITPNVDALRATIEPYVATALAYTAKLSGRAETAVTDLKSDKRI